MYNLIIVDDFPADRENLKEILRSFEDMNIRIVAECEDGRQVLDFIRSSPPGGMPDIVISDIEMPVMTGFELAGNIMRDFPGIRIIFCSLYNEFEYAREALYLDSYGYILKPVNRDELRACLEKTLGRIDVESRRTKEYEDLKKALYDSRPVLIEDFGKSLVYGLNRNKADIWSKLDFLGLRLDKSAFVLSLTEIDDFDEITRSMSMEQKQILSLKVYERIKRVVEGTQGLLSVKLDDSHFALLYSFQENLSDADRMKQVKAVCSRITYEFEKSDISLSTAVSGSCAEIIGINDLYEQCRYIIRYKYSLGKGKVLYDRDIPSGVKGADLNLNQLQKDIRFLLNSGSEAEINAYVDGLFRNVLPGADEPYCKNLCFSIINCMQVVLQENNESFKAVFSEENLIWEKLLRFETIVDAQKWIANIFVFIRSHLDRRNTSKNEGIIREVKKYVENNYTKDLTLEVISADLYYSPNYMNHIFKQQTGETIFDYITRFKIEKAKEMLADPKVKLYEVAETLGYSHTPYFSSVFKRYTGLTPKEYRERCVQ